jgi:hypothetical protein
MIGVQVIIEVGIASIGNSDVAWADVAPAFNGEKNQKGEKKSAREWSSRVGRINKRNHICLWNMAIPSPW